MRLRTANHNRRRRLLGGYGRRTWKRGFLKWSNKTSDEILEDIQWGRMLLLGMEPSVLSIPASYYEMLTAGGNKSFREQYQQAWLIEACTRPACPAHGGSGPGCEDCVGPLPPPFR